MRRAAGPRGRIAAARAAHRVLVNEEGNRRFAGLG
jgi:hypothetical protein